MRISLIVLTRNRADLAARTMKHNLTHAGCSPDELVWVDNGSTDGVRDVMMAYDPHVCVLNKHNVGFFKGCNRGFLVASGDFVTMVDDDMLMPDGWLDSFKTYLTRIPETGVACILWESPRLKVTEPREVNGLPLHLCYPLGRFIVSRERLLHSIGVYREDFGLIGPGDIEWGRRAARVCKENGLLTYALANLRSEHLGTKAHDGPAYFEYKKREANHPRKLELLRVCHAANYPYYNPYGVGPCTAVPPINS